MCYLFMVIIFVGWLLFIIILNFFWGQFDISMDRLLFYDFMKNYGDFIIIRVRVLLNYLYKALLVFFMNLKKTVWAFLGNRLKDSQKEYLIKIDRFFQSLVDFFIKIIKNIKPFLKLLIIIIATICFYINRFRQKRIYNHVGFGHKDLVAEATIIEFFVWDSAFDKSRSFSSTAKKSLFLVGSFCLKRGFIFVIIKCFLLCHILQGCLLFLQYENQLLWLFHLSLI